MDQDFIRQALLDRSRKHGESYEEAAKAFHRGMGTRLDVLEEIVEELRAEGRKNRLMEDPAGVVAKADPGELEREARWADWYTGPEPGDVAWPRLQTELQSGSLADVIDDINKASTKVVANLADPSIRRLRKRGLVVGYVQSGKTANYTAVMAKAADAGYRLFIVLAGMHNNLRRQTQARLEADLLDGRWATLTTDTEDFGRVVRGAPLLSKGVQTIAVVKKNASRLRRLRDWLRDVPESVRAATPILLLDDEADQATPNTKAAQDEISRINELVRQIWAEIPTGSYVGYTATPFANIFMNPDDDEELYPADFILDLPRPAEYFGAERIFGRANLEDAGDPEPGLDMVRVIPPEDAAVLAPPTDADQREVFRPDVPMSLEEAIRWFLLATAARWVRGQRGEHSSMLIHTTHYVQPHFAMRSSVQDLLDTYREAVDEGQLSQFEKQWLAESRRADEVATEAVPDWTDVAASLPQVLSMVRVVVDNGVSADRLDYRRIDDEGQRLVETVIAIGGGTLSRGLTLEGLAVSYFTRTSSTYDTLLQMGRWFGYRQGYEDLPRIWMTQDMAEEFEFLAGVEEEIRLEMRRLERAQATPRELGLRVRAHPGRLAITARSKMVHADLIRTSLSGQRLQTIILHERDGAVLAHNQRLVQELVVERLAETGLADQDPPHRWVLREVPSDRVVRFLNEFRFHPDQIGLRPDLMTGWINRVVPDAPWNLVIQGHGRSDELGTMGLGLPDEVPAINRSPLKRPTDVANIKALMSLRDRVADIDPRIVRESRASRDHEYQALRREHADGRGLIVVYPVSRHSQPNPTARAAESRRSMNADQHLVGLGLIFPEVLDPDVVDGDYWSVTPDWAVDAGSEDELPEDTEGSASVDGESLARELPS